MNSFFTYDKFEAMMTPSDCEAAQFRAKLKVSITAVFELLLFDKVVRTKMALLHRTLWYLAVVHVAFGHLYESC